MAYYLAMFVIRVLLDVQDDVSHQFEAQAQSDAKEVLARFDGCERYAVFRTVDARASYLLYEEWRDKESFDAYRTSEDFQRIGGRLRPMLAGPPESAYYEARLAT